LQVLQFCEIVLH